MMMTEPQPKGERTRIISPLEERLINQGLSFTMPERLQTAPNLPGLQIDSNTGLAIENDATRIHVATRFSKCIREGRRWMVVYGDIDNLKVANAELGRPFGDIVIRYGAATITQAVDRAELSPEAEIITLRQAHAGDEITVWIFNLSDEEIARIQEEVKTTESPVRIEDPQFAFSLSATSISSKDPRMQQKIRDTQQWLNQNEKRIAFNTYQEIVEKVDEDVKIAKIEKDLARLENIPEQELLTKVSMQAFIDMLTNSFGNSRISNKLLEVLLKLTSAQTVIAMTNSFEAKEAYMNLLRGIGITEEQMKTAQTPEDLIKLFKELFGSAD